MSSTSNNDNANGSGSGSNGTLNIVIVGGGMAGISVVFPLFSKPTNSFRLKKRDGGSYDAIHVYLLEKRDYYEYIPSSLRCMVNPAHFPEVSHSLAQFEQDLTSNFYKKYPEQKDKKVFKAITNCQVTALDVTNQKITYELLTSTSSTTNNNNGDNAAANGDGEQASEQQQEQIQVQQDQQDRQEQPQQNTNVVTLDYDYLIVATGASYSAPYIKPHWEKDLRLTDREQSFLQANEKLSSSDNKHIVVVGGGSVGVELVGELVDLRKKLGRENDLKITLVHGKDTLLERLTPKMHRYVSKFMRNNKVNVLLNDRIIPGDDFDYATSVNTSVIKSFKTQSGQELNDVTMVFWCINSDVRTSWIDNCGLALAEDGRVAVHANLQSTSHPNVFAVGDVNNYPCEKSGAEAHMQGEHLGAALLKVLSLGEDESAQYPEYKKMAKLAQNVSLGTKDGAFALGSMIPMWGCIAAVLKSKVEYHIGVKPIKYP